MDDGSEVEVESEHVNTVFKQEERLSSYTHPATSYRDVFVVSHLSTNRLKDDVAMCVMRTVEIERRSTIYINPYTRSIWNRVSIELVWPCQCLAKVRESAETVETLQMWQGLSTAGMLSTMFRGSNKEGEGPLDVLLHQDRGVWKACFADLNFIGTVAGNQEARCGTEASLMIENKHGDCKTGQMIAMAR